MYFDSKLTTYAELFRLNERGVSRVTIRRRGASLLQQLRQRPASDWTGAVMGHAKPGADYQRVMDALDQASKMATAWKHED